MDESSSAGSIAPGGKQSTASGLANFVNDHTAVGKGIRSSPIGESSPAGSSAPGGKQSAASGPGLNGNTAAAEGMESDSNSSITNNACSPTRGALREGYDTINPPERGGVVAETQLHGNKVHNR